MPENHTFNDYTLLDMFWAANRGWNSSSCVNLFVGLLLRSCVYFDTNPSLFAALVGLTRVLRLALNIHITILEVLGTFTVFL